MTLGQRIQELRKQAGLSQEALGEALGVSRQAVSKWEGDNGIPELDTLIAMSRLFGVTVGQLLGVESPEDPANEEVKDVPAGFTEEQVEQILRRYVEESRQHERGNRSSLLARIVAVCCVAAVGIVALVSTRQIRDVKQNVNTLWSNVIDVEELVSNVRNQVGGLSDELRGVLEEQASLTSTFVHEVCSFDVAQETVQVRFFATLKTYTADSQVQFVLNWKQVDGTEGQTVTDLVDGPDFVTWVTLPMNYHLDVSLRVLLPDGTIQEQPVDTIYSGMHPDNFKVLSYGRGSWTLPEEGRFGYHADLRSEWPDQVYPVRAEIVILLNGEEVYREATPFTSPEKGHYQIQGDIRLEPYKKSDSLQAWFYVTDNFGRVEEFQLPVDMTETEAHAW